MTTEECFLSAIRANPADRVAWKVYADFLDEQGRPGEARRWRRDYGCAEFYVPFLDLLGYSFPLPPAPVPLVRCVAQEDGLVELPRIAVRYLGPDAPGHLHVLWGEKVLIHWLFWSDTVFRPERYPTDPLVLRRGMSLEVRASCGSEAVGDVRFVCMPLNIVPDAFFPA